MTKQELESHDSLVAALKEVLRDEQPDGIVLIKRIPFICKDINDIKTNMKWITRLVIGVAGGIGLLALKQLGV